MLSFEQFLVFEIAAGCNLSKEHAAHCPSGRADRWQRLPHGTPISDQLIYDAVRQAYRDLGFRGQVAWHYYCEPMLAWDRLKRLLPRMRGRSPKPRFCLWTNGTRFPPDLSELRIFDSLWISNYENLDRRPLARIVPDLHVLNGLLDDRTGGALDVGTAPCRRPFNEVIIDYYGNVHLCCMDWRGEISIGNLWRESLQTLAARFVGLRDMVMCSPMPVNAPTVCRACAFRDPQPAKLVPPIDTEALEYARAKPCES